MAILDIVIYPDQRLRETAVAVEQIDDEVKTLVADMLETMYDAPGVGLAATQIGDNRRVVVIDVSENKDSPLALINPQIISKQGQAEGEEGCLSIPGVFDRVVRAEEVTFSALDVDGTKYQMQADGLLSVCVQHEVDHLDGKLFVDYLSALKRNRIRKKMLKQEKSNN